MILIRGPSILSEARGAPAVDPCLMERLQAEVEACAREAVDATGEGCIFQV